MSAQLLEAGEAKKKKLKRFNNKPDGSLYLKTREKGGKSEKLDKYMPEVVAVEERAREQIRRG